MLSGWQITEQISKRKYKKILEEMSLEELFDMVLKSGNAKLMYIVALDFNSIDKDKFSRAIASTENIKYIILFVKNIKGANIEVLGEAVSLYGNMNDIRMFIKDIKNAPIEILERAIIDSNNPKEILYTLLYTKKIHSCLFIEALLRIGNIDCIINSLIYARKLSAKEENMLLKSVYDNGLLVQLFESLIKDNNYKKFFKYIDIVYSLIDFKDLVILFSQINMDNLTEEYKGLYISYLYKYKLYKEIKLDLNKSVLDGKSVRERIEDKKRI